ncbi:MAG: hypothetical protein IVW55_17670 [Chloroflexi bacterium]|nr:hypothetical protein [Chloroflexota bacterium]
MSQKTKQQPKTATTICPGSPAAQTKQKARRATYRRGMPKRQRRSLIIGVAAALLAIALLFFLLPRGVGNSGAISTLGTSDYHALVFNPDDPNTVFFGHHGGIMRSNDAGQTWTTLVDKKNFDAMGIVVNPTNSRQVYMAGHDIFQVSSDGGATWRPVQHNLPGTDIHGFAAATDGSNRLFAYVVGSGVLQSSDGGSAWQPTGGQMPPDVMSLATGGDPTSLYAVSMGSGMLRSTNTGKSWTPVQGDLASSNIYAVAVDPKTSSTLYAGVEGGLYKSTDTGATWKKTTYPGDNAVALAISPTRPQLVLAVNAKSREGLVFRSEDGGATWSGQK